MRIVITNIVVLNGGDGAILFGMINALRKAFGEDTALTVFASEPAAASRMYPEIQFRETIGLGATQAPAVRYLGRIVRTLRSAVYLFCARCHGRGLRFITRLLLGTERCGDYDAYASADLVISSGGTYLKEEYGLVSQICDYRITLLLGKSLAFYTQSLGPFKYPESKTAMLPLFNAASAMLLRDERSRQNLLDIGVTNPRIALSPDAAFALADPAVLEQAQHRKLPADRPLRIAFSVRHWPHFKGMTTAEGMEHYCRSMAELTQWLVTELKADVTFLSTCQGNTEYSDDSEIACQVVRRLDSKTASRVNVVREFVRFDELLRRLPNFDLVLATRMHMCILSLISGTPAIPLALEFKTNELFANLGLGEWVFNVEEFDLALARNKISKFLSQLPNFRADLFRRVEKERVGALESGRMMAQFIGKSAS